jgi:hypothetical protein
VGAATRAISGLASALSAPTQGIPADAAFGSYAPLPIWLLQEKSPPSASMPVTVYMILCFIVLEKQHLRTPASSAKCEKNSILVDFFFGPGKIATDEAL